MRRRLYLYAQRITHAVLWKLFVGSISHTSQILINSNAIVVRTFISVLYDNDRLPLFKRNQKNVFIHFDRLFFNHIIFEYICIFCAGPFNKITLFYRFDKLQYGVVDVIPA